MITTHRFMQSSCLIRKASEKWISCAGIIRFPVVVCVCVCVAQIAVFHTQAFLSSRVLFSYLLSLILLSAVSLFAILKLR